MIREPDLVGSFAAPPGVGPFPGVLALGGSDGGLPEYFTDLLVPEGFACLALGYFGIDDLPAGLVEVPLERIERGLRWLAAHPRVAPRDGRVAIIGVSRGAELALLVASTFPDLVGPVAVYTPSHVVWPGVDYTAQPGAVTPSWTHRGQPLACMTYRAGAAPTFSERGVALVALSDQALDDPAAIERAAIPIERAAGPLLLISGGDDHVWAAERMCRMAVERMRTHGRGDAVLHLCYPAAGHALFPYAGPSGTVPQQVMRLDFGGSVEPAGRRMPMHGRAWSRSCADRWADARHARKPREG